MGVLCVAPWRHRQLLSYKRTWVLVPTSLARVESRSIKCVNDRVACVAHSKRLSELKTARIVVFVDAASLPQRADRRLVLPQQLRPRNSDSSGAGAVIMVVVGRVSGQQLCQLLSLVELQDVDKVVYPCLDCLPGMFRGCSRLRARSCNVVAC